MRNEAHGCDWAALQRVGNRDEKFAARTECDDFIGCHLSFTFPFRIVTAAGRLRDIEAPEIPHHLDSKVLQALRDICWKRLNFGRWTWQQAACNLNAKYDRGDADDGRAVSLCQAKAVIMCVDFARLSMAINLVWQKSLSRLLHRALLIHLVAEGGMISSPRNDSDFFLN